MQNSAQYRNQFAALHRLCGLQELPQHIDEVFDIELSVLRTELSLPTQSSLEFSDVLF